MTSQGKSDAFISSRNAGGTAAGRTADNAGPAAETDPRLNEQLSLLSGQSLSQYSIAINGVRLSFWGQDTATPSREILIENETIEITGPGRQPCHVPSRSDLTATTLLATLDHRLRVAQITSGRLVLTFDNDVELAVNPHPAWESWEITSADRMLIVCTPGGELAIWYPPEDH